MPPKYRSLHPHPYAATEAELRDRNEKTKADVTRQRKPGRSPSRRPPATTDPLDPKIERWLRTQEPRVELAMRYAMRENFPKVRASRSFSARVDEVRAKLSPSEDELAMILKDARAIGKSMGEMLDPKYWK